MKHLRGNNSVIIEPNVKCRHYNTEIRITKKRRSKQ